MYMVLLLIWLTPIPDPLTYAWYILSRDSPNLGMSYVQKLTHKSSAWSSEHIFPTATG